MTAGVDRITGRILPGFAHVRQSLEVIFTTAPGERVMRRDFGAPLQRLLGKSLLPDTLGKARQAVALGVAAYEPRLVPDIVRFTAASEEELRHGKIKLAINGQYRPRALEGDFTVDSTKTMSI